MGPARYLPGRPSRIAASAVRLATFRDFGI